MPIYLEPSLVDPDFKQEAVSFWNSGNSERRHGLKVEFGQKKTLSVTNKTIRHPKPKRKQASHSQVSTLATINAT